MNELPSGWKLIKVSEAYWFQEGPGVRRWQFKTSGIKLLNVGNITKENTLDLDKTDRHLDREEVEAKYRHFLVDAGDLVIASSGISFDEDGFLRTRGAFVAEEHLPLCMNTSTIRFKSKEGVSDLRYLRYWLQSNEFRAQVSKFVTGSAQLNFGPSHLKKMSISLPPLPEQQRIAAILDKADALRAKRRAALAKLDTLLQATFLDMFGDPVTNPMGWEEAPLSDCIIGKASNGFFAKNDKYGDEGTPVIWIGNFLDRFYAQKHGLKRVEATTKAIKKNRVDYGDVLFCRSSLTPAGIGKASIVPPDLTEEVIFECHIIKCTLNQKLLVPEYFRVFSDVTVQSPLSKRQEGIIKQIAGVEGRHCPCGVRQ